MTHQRPQLSIVILCYRAGEFSRTFVDQTLKALQTASIEDYELVLVGNYVEGTADVTPQVVQDLARQNPRIVSSTKIKQGWMGWDMRSGLSLAQGQYIAVIDGDGQMPIQDVITVYEKIRQERLDFVKTYRLTRGDSFLRKSISYIYNFSFHCLFPGFPAKDINSKPKIMTRQAYEKMHLTSDDWFIDAEIMIEVRRHALRFAEIPTVFLGPIGRRSFISAVAILEFFKNLVIYRIRECRRKNS